MIIPTGTYAKHEPNKSTQKSPPSKTPEPNQSNKLKYFPEQKVYFNKFNLTKKGLYQIDKYGKK